MGQFQRRAALWCVSQLHFKRAFWGTRDHYCYYENTGATIIGTQNLLKNKMKKYAMPKIMHTFGMCENKMSIFKRGRNNSYFWGQKCHAILSLTADKTFSPDTGATDCQISIFQKQKCQIKIWWLQILLVHFNKDNSNIQIKHPTNAAHILKSKSYQITRIVLERKSGQCLAVGQTAND